MQELITATARKEQAEAAERESNAVENIANAQYKEAQTAEIAQKIQQSQVDTALRARDSLIRSQGEIIKNRRLLLEPVKLN